MFIDASPVPTNRSTPTPHLTVRIQPQNTMVWIHESLDDPAQHRRALNYLPGRSSCTSPAATGERIRSTKTGKTSGNSLVQILTRCLTGNIQVLQSKVSITVRESIIELLTVDDVRGRRIDWESLVFGPRAEVGRCK